MPWLCRYYVSVSAVNGAGLRASAAAVPLLVDASPPSAVLVHNLPSDAPGGASPNEPSFSADVSTVSASYVHGPHVWLFIGAFTSPGPCVASVCYSIYFRDSESGISSYLYRVCPLFVPARQCIDGGVCTASSFASVACDDGSVCVLDTHGTPTCHDGSVCHGEDLDSLPNCDHDNPCTEDTCASAPKRADGSAMVVAVGSFALRHGGMYYIDAWATNGVGARARAKSRGWTVDLTEPEIADPAEASVTAASSGRPISFQSDWRSAGAEWEGVFRDQESSIADYRLCVGYGPLQSDVLACTSVGIATAAELALPAPTADNAADLGKEFYFVTVEAVNGAGAVARAVSAPVQVDVTPPVPGIVQDGLGEEDVAFVVANGALAATWAGFSDNDSDIAFFTVGWTTDPAGTVGAVGPVNVGLVSEYLVANLFLEHGTTYYAVVTAVNHAGGMSSSVSNGVTVALRGPDASGASVVVGNGEVSDMYLTNLDQVNASWAGFVGVTGLPVVGFEVGVCRVAVDCVESDFVDVGPDTTFRRSGLRLQNGADYRVVVRARNAVSPSSDTHGHALSQAYLTPHGHCNVCDNVYRLALSPPRYPHRSWLMHRHRR